MKNLNLKAMGVQEMNHSELVQTEGGLGFIAVVVVAAIAVVASSCVTVVKTEVNRIHSDNGDKNTGNANGNKGNGNNNGTNNGGKK